jgi:hypothetical protein
MAMRISGFPGIAKWKVSCRLRRQVEDIPVFQVGDFWSVVMKCMLQVLAVNYSRLKPLLQHFGIMQEQSSSLLKNPE